MTSLFDLPNETFELILGKLDYRNIVRCSEVSRQLKEIIFSSAELQYIIGLGAEGLEDNPSSDLALCDRLSALNARRERFQNLSRKRHEPIQQVTLEQNLHAFELAGGVYAMLSGSPSIEVQQVFCACWLPPGTKEESADNGAAEENVFRMVGKSVRWEVSAIKDFAMDPTQDLLVFIETDDHIAIHTETDRPVRMHVRTLSGNNPHPLAASPVLEKIKKINPIVRVYPQLLGDLVGFFSPREDKWLFIWNWKTGRLFIDWVISEDVPEASDVASLPNRNFIVCDRAGSGALHIFAPVDSDSTPESVVHLVKLELPPLRKGVQASFMGIYMSPILGGPRKSSPFRAADDASLIVLTLEYQMESEYKMFIRSEAILKYTRESRHQNGAVMVPWKEWGPNNTRLMASGDLWGWIRYVQGSRVVAKDYQNGYAKLYDFSPGAGREGTANPQFIPKYAPMFSTLENSVIENEAIFTEPVITKMPYQLTSMVCSRKYPDFFIDEEQIIGAEGVNSGGLNVLDVYHV